jgi:hypothetical protein
MRPNAVLIVANILSNLNETYNTKFQIVHRDKQDDYVIKIDGQPARILYRILSCLDSNTLSFILEGKDTFIIF